MKQLKKTPLFNSYKKYGGKVIDFAGWALPVQFEGIISEHEAVRTKAGLFDVSHMGEIEVIGEHALKFVQSLITNDAAVLQDNQALYALMCYPEGGVVDDLIVYRFTKNHFFLVVNAANVQKDFQWMLSNKGTFKVDIRNISLSVAQLAIQGPKAEKILQKLTGSNLSDIKFFFCKRDVFILGIKCLVSRTGYTGEDGFEIYTDTKSAADLWNEILKAGKEEGIKAVGLGARDTLRFEAGLPLYGNELSESITPLEAGLGFFVKLDKEYFIGKDALVKQKQKGLKRNIVGFEMKDRIIPRHGYEVFAENEKIGEVTTGYFSPSLKKNVGLALIDYRYAQLGSTIFIKVRNKLYEAVVVNKKFYSTNTRSNTLRFFKE